MNAQALQQVQEIVKSVNIAFDGKLNSDTLFQVVKEATPQVMQYLYFLQIKGFLVSLMWCVAVVFSAFLIGKTVAKLVKES